MTPIAGVGEGQEEEETLQSEGFQLYLSFTGMLSLWWFAGCWAPTAALLSKIKWKNTFFLQRKR